MATVRCLLQPVSTTTSVHYNHCPLYSSITVSPTHLTLPAYSPVTSRRVQFNTSMLTRLTQKVIMHNYSSYILCVTSRPPTEGGERCYFRPPTEGGERCYFRPPTEGGERCYFRPPTEGGERCSCCLQQPAAPALCRSQRHQ